MPGLTAPLPIYDLEEEIVARLRERPRLILSAPTGSGKSTQVPQILLRRGLLDSGQVVILQPRRLAARLLAARVARETGTTLGREVGYQVRFESVCGAETRIRYVTEGILLRQMIDDSALPGVAVVIFDEFHERHLYGDITLARALELQERGRPDLRLIVMSATLDVDALEAYLRPCSRLSSEGRVHPVSIDYIASSKEPSWELAAEAFARHIREGGSGDALVFMPGAYEISRTLEALRERREAKGYALLPLHGELPPAEQDSAVARHDRPKIVVATNVAETSITIEGVTLVIDSGLARIPRFDPYRGINTLLVEKISRASADQREGRAGRTAPGRCVRLWTEREHSARALRETPEIKRLDLAEVVLALKAAGVAELKSFRWLEPPEPKSLASAEALLVSLGALGRDGAITGLGRRMLAFPVHPRYSRMLLAAGELGCVPEAALVAALTQGRDLLVRGAEPPRGGAGSDFEVLIEAWSRAAAGRFSAEACRRAGVHVQTARQVGPLRDQFLRIAEREGLEPRSRGAGGEALRRCILLGFSDRVARRGDAATARCELVGGRRGTLARESVVRDRPLIVAAEVREVEGKELSTLLSLVTAIEPAWLQELFPGDMSRRTQIGFDPSSRRVFAHDQVLFRDLVLEAKEVEPPAEAAARALADEIVSGRLKLRSWDEAVEQWVLRVNLLGRWCPELGLPPIDGEARRAIVEDLCHGAAGFKAVQDRDAKGAVQGWLGEAQRAQVERHAPDRVELSNGRRVKVSYAADAPPFVSVKIQDLYGVERLPPVAMGRQALVVKILAPNMRPVQVTQDLLGFWSEHYPRIKRELQRRYPKHEWR